MKQDLLPHLVVFCICLAILAGTLILTPPTDDVPSIQLFHIPLPGICAFRSVTGIPCPGCGLARSMVSALHGGVAKSLEYHRLGIIVLAYVIVQFIYRGSVLVSPDLRKRSARLETILNRGIILLGVVLVLNWIITLFRFI
jgi:hypothetical protein